MAMQCILQVVYKERQQVRWRHVVLSSVLVQCLGSLLENAL